MTAETIIMIALQFIGFAFLFGGQHATLKGLMARIVDLEGEMKRLTEAMTELTIEMAVRSGRKRKAS